MEHNNNHVKDTWASNIYTYPTCILSNFNKILIITMNKCTKTWANWRFINRTGEINFDSLTFCFCFVYLYFFAVQFSFFNVTFKWICNFFLQGNHFIVFLTWTTLINYKMSTNYFFCLRFHIQVVDFRRNLLFHFDYFHFRLFFHWIFCSQLVFLSVGFPLSRFSSQSIFLSINFPFDRRLKIA